MCESGKRVVYESFGKDFVCDGVMLVYAFEELQKQERWTMLMHSLQNSGNILWQLTAFRVPLKVFQNLF